VIMVFSCMVPRVKYPRYLYSTWGKKEVYTLGKVTVYTKAVGNARVGVGLSGVPPLSQILEISVHTPLWHMNVFFWSDLVVIFLKRKKKAEENGCIHVSCNCVVVETVEMCNRTTSIGMSKT